MNAKRALPPSLQKNIVGRGRPLLYVYTCADFKCNVKSVSNLSSGCYKNINIISNKEEAMWAHRLTIEYVLSAVYPVYISLWIDYFYTVQKCYVTFFFYYLSTLVVQSRRASVLHPFASSDPLDARRYSFVHLFYIVLNLAWVARIKLIARVETIAASKEPERATRGRFRR